MKSRLWARGGPCPGLARASNQSCQAASMGSLAFPLGAIYTRSIWLRICRVRIPCGSVRTLPSGRAPPMLFRHPIASMRGACNLYCESSNAGTVPVEFREAIGKLISMVRYCRGLPPGTSSPPPRRRIGAFVARAELAAPANCMTVLAAPTMPFPSGFLRGFADQGESGRTGWSGTALIAAGIAGVPELVEPGYRGCGR